MRLRQLNQLLCGLLKLDRPGIGSLWFNSILALGFECGIRLHPIEFSEIFKGGSERDMPLGRVREFSIEAGRQVFKDDAALAALTSL